MYAPCSHNPSVSLPDLPVELILPMSLTYPGLHPRNQVPIADGRYHSSFSNFASGISFVRHLLLLLSSLCVQPLSKLLDSGCVVCIGSRPCDLSMHLVKSDEAPVYETCARNTWRSPWSSLHTRLRILSPWAHAVLATTISLLASHCIPCMASDTACFRFI
jgi:hypothetical protein